MEQKKTSKADLENKRNMFLLIGLVAALGITLLAFEWTTKPSRVNSLGEIQTQEVEEEFIPITREQQVKPPELPPPKVIEVLNIVDDDFVIEDELEIEDSEADDETIIDIAPVISTKEEEEVEEEQIFISSILEQPAEFPGGTKGLYNYISTHVKYPIIAQENGIEGKVYVKFVVDEQGNVSRVEVLRNVDPALDTEALRVINSLPQFKPGRQRGVAVKVYYQAVINFDLQ